MKAQSSRRAPVVAQPLYAQVRERLLERIVGKEWQQGQMLPNEFDLARQFGVSIGTIRKAVEGLETARMVVRKQGRGTFVARDSTAPAVEPISWFAETGATGAGATVSTLSIATRPASVAEASALRLGTERTVITIRRRRSFEVGGAVLDRIALPLKLFFDFESEGTLPPNLYEFYGDYFGVRAVKCTEAIGVAAADQEMAAALSVPVGEPVLKIERTSYSAGGEPMEWRESYCQLTKGLSFSGAC